MLLVLSRFIFRFYTAPCSPGDCVSRTAVVSGIAFSPLPKRTISCVVFDSPDSWPAVVCDLPQFRSVDISRLKHTNFSPPSGIAVMAAQLVYAVVQFLFITMSEYSVPLGDILNVVI